MSLTKKYHRTCIVRSYCDLTIFMEKWTNWTLHSTAKMFSSIGINYSIIRSYYTSDYWQPGVLVTFFNYISGLLFPKRIMRSQSGSITFRRVGYSICVHR